MKIGDYVRFKNGTIKKIHSFSEKDNPLFNILINAQYYNSSDIKTSSPNIIDLIEVGDYVNGHKVIYTAGEKHKLVYVEYVNMSKLLEVKSYQIKSIVTKEQFESMEYKIGD